MHLLSTHKSIGTPAVTSLHEELSIKPSVSIITDRKRQGSQVDRDRGVRKRQRRMGNFAEGVSQSLMRYMTQVIRPTSPDTDFGHGDETSVKSSPD